MVCMSVCVCVCVCVCSFGLLRVGARSLNTLDAPVLRGLGADHAHTPNSDHAQVQSGNLTFMGSPVSLTLMGKWAFGVLGAFLGVGVSAFVKSPPFFDLRRWRAD